MSQAGARSWQDCPVGRALCDGQAQEKHCSRWPSEIVKCFAMRRQNWPPSPAAPTWHPFGGRQQQRRIRRMMGGTGRRMDDSPRLVVLSPATRAAPRSTQGSSPTFEWPVRAVKLSSGTRPSPLHHGLVSKVQPGSPLLAPASARLIASADW